MIDHTTHQIEGPLANFEAVDATRKSLGHAQVVQDAVRGDGNAAHVQRGVDVQGTVHALGPPRHRLAHAHLQECIAAHPKKKKNNNKEGGLVVLFTISVNKKKNKAMITHFI